MEIKLDITSDTSNTFPTDKLLLKSCDDDVSINITNDDRVIRVNKLELLKAIKALDSN